MTVAREGTNDAAEPTARVEHAKTRVFAREELAEERKTDLGVTIDLGLRLRPILFVPLLHVCVAFRAWVHSGRPSSAFTGEPSLADSSSSALRAARNAASRSSCAASS